MPVILSSSVIYEKVIEYALKIPAMNNVVLTGIDKDLYRESWKVRGYQCSHHRNQYHYKWFSSKTPVRSGFIWRYVVNVKGDMIRTISAMDLVRLEEKSIEALCAKLMRDCDSLHLTDKEIRLSLAALCSFTADLNAKCSIDFSKTWNDCLSILFNCSRFYKAIFNIPSDSNIEMSLVRRIVTDPKYAEMLVASKGVTETASACVGVGRIWEEIQLILPANFPVPSCPPLEVKDSLTMAAAEPNISLIFAEESQRCDASAPDVMGPVSADGPEKKKSAEMLKTSDLTGEQREGAASSSSTYTLDFTPCNLTWKSNHSSRRSSDSVMSSLSSVAISSVAISSVAISSVTISSVANSSSPSQLSPRDDPNLQYMLETAIKKAERSAIETANTIDILRKMAEYNLGKQCYQAIIEL